MKKISIIGASGTGKTTLAFNLSKVLNIPAYHLDGINYKPNWVEIDKKERDKIIFDIIKKDKWIIDGTYTSTIHERLEKSDCIIFLDYSSITQFINIFKRHLKLKNCEKPEIPGCKERLDLDFLLFVFKWKKNKRGLILDELSKLKNKEILIFKNRKSLNKWYEEKFNKKIEY